MTDEQLQKAKQLEKDIAALQSHKDAFTGRRSAASFTIAVDAHNYNYLALKPQFFIVPKELFFDQYEAAIDRSINELKKQLEAL